MKSVFFMFMILSAGVVYANYFIAQQEEQKSTRFIVSQVENGKNDLQKSLTANILAEDSSTEKKQTPVSPSKAIVSHVINDIKTTSDTTEDVPQTGEAAGTSLTNQAGTTQSASKPVSSQPFSLIKSLPGSGVTSWQSGKAFTFEFSEDTDIESFFANFVFTPSTDGKFSGEMNYGNAKNIIIVNPVPKLTVNTQYTVTLKNGIKSFDKTKTLSVPVSFMVDVK